MRTRRSVLVLAAAISVSVVGCKKDDAKPAASGSASQAAAEQKPEVPAGAVQLFVDDKPVGTLAPEQIAMWPRLDSLVPMAARRLGTWETITLAGSAPTEIKHPSATYPEYVPALYPGEGGAAAFGMFDPVELAKRGTPAVNHAGISQVRIALATGTGRGENDHHGSEGGGDPTKLELHVKSKQGDHVIPGTKLVEIPREPQPGEGGDAKGWKLGKILEQVGITKYKRLLLSDVNGVTLTLEERDLDPAKAIPFLKLNRQGTLRFRVYRKQGDTWQPSGDLRGLELIEVLE